MKRIGTFTTHRLESGIDLGARVGIVDLNLQSHGTNRSGHFLQLSIGESYIGWVDKHANSRGLRKQIAK
jgi:hypothetical protein